MKCKLVAVLILIALITVTLSIPVLAGEKAGQPTVSVIQVERLTEYRLAKYDILSIFILGLDEGSFKDVMIGPDGYINLPYAGPVKLTGLTIAEATDLLKSKLGEYLKIPSGMTVNVKQYGTRKIYVLGEVSKPGVVKLDWDSMDVISAITTAGGIASKGRPKHVAVIRKCEDKVQMREINFDRLVQGPDLSQNVSLQDGDIVYVPKSNKIDINTDVMPIISQYWVLDTLFNK